MYRSHNCGELNASHINTEVTLAGWVQKSRDKGFMNWVDLRDRYGITQLIFDESRTEKSVFELAKTLGRHDYAQKRAAVADGDPDRRQSSACRRIAPRLFEASSLVEGWKSTRDCC